MIVYFYLTNDISYHPKYYRKTMSFNLLRSESVSPRASASVGATESVVVEIVDSTTKPTAGKKSSRRNQIVIDVEYSTGPATVPIPVPVPVQAAAEPLKTTVDDRALEIARAFYNSQSDSIRSILTRKDLAARFHSTMSESPVSFAMVLFAMAKGMRVVNVYDSGAKLEWRTIAPTTGGGAAKPSSIAAVKPAPIAAAKPSAAPAKMVTDKDGWSTIIAKGGAKAQNIVVAAPAITTAPAPTITAAPAPTITAITDTPTASVAEDELISVLQETKSKIRRLETEIETLVDEHTNIKHQITLCPIQRVVDFHRVTIATLESLLDGLEAERVELIAHKNELCDKLKN